MATPSHVAPKAFREMRTLTRYRRTLTVQRGRVRKRVQKVMDRSGVRVGGVLSDVFSRNGRRIRDALAEGLERDAILASLSHHVAHKLERFCACTASTNVMKAASRFSSAFDVAATGRTSAARLST